MRIGAFTASSFSQLGHCLEDFPGNCICIREDMPEFHITAAHSRLFHTGAIAERFAKT
ncbi:MAG: hypothetical protein R2941_06385 [Desulfobacterales bacterium]